MEAMRQVDARLGALHRVIAFGAVGISGTLITGFIGIFTLIATRL